jgi:dihydroorotate dehydrogenase electron transfer subunit
MTESTTCSGVHGKGVFAARVVANEPVCREHHRLVLRLPAFPDASPGQFVQVLCTEPGELGWTGGAFIRRPFSIGGLRRAGSGDVDLEITHRAIGVGTRWLSRLEPGDPVNLLGPLGQPFRLPVSGQRALLVGGGVGLPPLIWLAEALQRAGTGAVAFCGSRTAELLPLTRVPGVACSGECASLCCREFARCGVSAVVATDDGSLGGHGVIPDVFAAWLDRNPAAAAGGVVYTCGPDRMMHAVARICRARDLPCQVCLERMMACGMGTCQSCVVRIRDAGAPDGWRYRLCCSDGPVFDAEEVIWG